MAQRLLARSDSPQPLAPADLDDLVALEGQSGLVWLDVETGDPDELDRLGQQFGFDPSAIEDILDIEQLPKYDDYGDHLFVVLHALTAAGDRVDTREVDIFVREGLLVTVHAEPILGINWLWEAVQSHPHLAEKGADELFGHLAEVIGRRYFEIANVIEQRIDELAEAALAADSSVLGEIQVLRREEATVRTMLRPQRLVISELRIRNRSVIGEQAVGLLDDAYDIHNQVVESLGVARGLLNDTLDSYRGASAERQANATTVLAVYSAILLPLSLIASWYGMNVQGLPAADRNYGWQIVTLGMLLLALASCAVFVKIGLIRLYGGRTSRIGRGLAAAARAPVKPIIMLRDGRTARSTGSEASAKGDGSRRSQ